MDIDLEIAAAPMDVGPVFVRRETAVLYEVVE
jgi:hypothetical protein